MSLTNHELALLQLLRKVSGSKVELRIEDARLVHVARRRGARAGNAILPRYRTPGPLQFFGCRGSILADGRHARLSPQACYHRRPFVLMGDYMRSRPDVTTAAGFRATLDLDAWQRPGRWVLTGADVGYRGVAAHDEAFTSAGTGLGALELVARLKALEIDSTAFPLFADPAVAEAGARTWGIGLNWYLTGNLRLAAHYVHTRFDTGPGSNAGFEDEDLSVTRVQLSF